MIRSKLTRAKFALTLAMYFVPLAAFVLAGYLRFAAGIIPMYSTDVEPYSYFGLLLLTTFVWSIVVEKQGLAAIENLFRREAKLRAALLACGTTCVTVLALTFFYRITSFSRVFISLSVLNLFLLTFLVQSFFPWLWRVSGNPRNAVLNLLIVGADEFAVRIANSLLDGHTMPCRIAGHIRLPGQTPAVQGIPVHELADIGRLAVGRGIDDVIIAVPPAMFGELPSLCTKLESLCVPMRAVVDLAPGMNSRHRLFNLGSLLLLDLQPTPADSVLYVLFKRAFDLLFSLAVLFVAAPVMLLIGAAIVLTSPGPAIFVQERVGLNGKPFRMYKFRTMTTTGPQESDARWTVRGDPRCTRFGRLLRRTGLDELPQFFNVLKGDMSVVGPRPERPLLVEKFRQSVCEYNTRHYLKVGITGWAQVNGWRGDTSIEKRVEFDLYYVRHWTITFDLMIVLLTFFRGFTDKNAY